MADLQQAGIFKAMPTQWDVLQAESGAVGVNIKFRVVDELDQEAPEDQQPAWVSWENFEPHYFFGTWWVVKKDGTVNTKAVEQLAESMGWSGDLLDVFGTPPAVLVQVTVKADTYNGETRYKGSWMNPGDFAPTGFGASESQVKTMQTRFGSLLKAAAAGARKAKPAPTEPSVDERIADESSAYAQQQALDHGPVPNEDHIPF